MIISLSPLPRTLGLVFRLLVHKFLGVTISKFVGLFLKIFDSIFASRFIWSFEHMNSNINDRVYQKSNEVFARQLWSCEHCGKIDSQSHIMWCPSLVALREGLDIDNDLDVVSYYQQVIKLRETLPER